MVLVHSSQQETMRSDSRVIHVSHGNTGICHAPQAVHFRALNLYKTRLYESAKPGGPTVR